jgi:hypothetical protein
LAVAISTGFAGDRREHFPLRVFVDMPDYVVDVSVIITEKAQWSQYLHASIFCECFNSFVAIAVSPCLICVTFEPFSRDFIWFFALRVFRATKESFFLCVCSVLGTVTLC